MAAKSRQIRAFVKGQMDHFFRQQLFACPLGQPQGRQKADILAPVYGYELVSQIIGEIGRTWFDQHRWQFSLFSCAAI